MRLLAPLLLVVLMGCDRFTGSEGDIEAIAHDAASDATNGKFSDLDSRISDMESKIRDLETANADLEAELERNKHWDKRITDAVISDMDGMSKQIGQLRDNYNRHTH